MASASENRRTPFPSNVPKPEKRQIGRSVATLTPLHVRSLGAPLDERTDTLARTKVGRKLKKFALHIERATVRFEDVNGPRGGIDQSCRIKVVVSSIPSIVVEESATTRRLALDRAAASVERAVRRALGRAGFSAPKKRLSGRRGAKRASPGVKQRSESRIGRREGQSAENIERVAQRPEKERRDALVDTSKPRTSATARKAGAGSTAGRNTKLNVEKMTAALEDSLQDRPSRKSTRKSTGRTKRDSNLRRRETRAVTSPKARARRARET